MNVKHSMHIKKIMISIVVKTKIIIVKIIALNNIFKQNKNA